MYVTSVFKVHKQSTEFNPNRNVILNLTKLQP